MRQACRSLSQRLEIAIAVPHTSPLCSVPQTRRDMASWHGRSIPPTALVRPISCRASRRRPRRPRPQGPPISTRPGAIHDELNVVPLPVNEDSWLGKSVTGMAGNVITLNGPAYQAEVAATVKAANAAGLYVILHLHL